MPLALSQQSDVHLGRMDTAIYALPMSALLSASANDGDADSKRYLIELHNRFSFPAACLVLMLVGVPLGVTSRRGGKSSGFVFTMLLVFVYYFLSSTGIALGQQRQAAGVSRGVVGQPAVCRGRHFSALADGDRRPDPERDLGVGFATAQVQSSLAKRERIPADAASRQASSRARNGKPARRFPAHSRRIRRARIRQACFCWCLPAL